METKICPILGSGPVEINSNCKGEYCAFWINDPDNGGCALAVMAKAAAKTTTHLDCAAYALESISANTL